MSVRTAAKACRWLFAGLSLLLPACTMVQYPAAADRHGQIAFPPRLASVPTQSALALQRTAPDAKLAELATRGDGWRWIDGRLDTIPQPDGTRRAVVKTAFSKVAVTRLATGRRGVVEEIIPAHRRENVPRFPGWRGALPEHATLLYTEASPTLQDRFGSNGTFDSDETPGVEPSTLLTMPTESLVLWATGPKEHAKGIVIWLHSAGGRAYERPLVRRLVKNGWWVLESEFPWPLERNRAYVVDHVGGAWLTQTADDLATEFSQRLLIVSDAVNTSLRLLEDSRGLGGLPRVVVGASLGGFTAPAVCAGLDRAPVATVFIDTGADLIDLLRHSPLPDARVEMLAFHAESSPGPDGTRTLKGRSLNQAEVVEVTREFDARCVLGPARLLPALSRTPALVVSATDDEIVRCASREELWEKLGRPERWQLNVGHEMLVYLLPHWGDEIVGWIDRVGPKSGSQAALTRD